MWDSVTERIRDAADELSQGLSQVRLTDGSGTQDSDPSQEDDSRPSPASHSHSHSGEVSDSLHLLSRYGLMD